MRKRYGAKVICFFVCLFMLISVGNVFLQSVYAEKTEATDENTPEVYYKGKATANVNVRVGAGEKNKKLLLNGAPVQLKKGEAVIILDEVMVGDKAWYHIRVTRGDETVEGYSTSSFIQKLKAITPTPEPTPTPKPSPSPTPQPTKAAEPTVTAIPVVSEASSGGSGVIIIIVIVVVLAAAAGVIFLILSKNRKNSGQVISKVVERMKQAPDKREKLIQKVQGSKQTKNEEQENTGIKTSSGIYIKQASEPVINDFDEYMSPEEIRHKASKELEGKKLLRAELDTLLIHDLVEHRFFGKGEIFDNTDVKLIEIRFGDDVRFLNKDTIAAKKLLRILNEEAPRRK